MKLIEFFKEKAIFLGINLIMFSIIVTLMVLSGASALEIFFLGCSWFLPILIYICIEYFRYKRHFNEIHKILDGLDKKYLLPEIVEEADFIIGEEINEILKILSRDMHENVKYYRIMQEEYREYIETWVHEIKTPISSAKLIIENNNNEVSKRIDQQLDRVENYVEQVLYYSRSDEVGKDYIIREVSLDKVVKNIIKRNFRDFRNKNIKIELENIDFNVYSDSKWLEFILNQLISNSIKYSRVSDGIIHIKGVDLENTIVLEIADNGVGIVERDINRVFDKGFTGENGRIFGKSTGMGLYLCKKLCSRLGLVLEIKSKIDEGTKVSIKFVKKKRSSD